MGYNYMGFFDKIFSGLTKTRNNMEELEELFQDYQPDSEDFYEELEELLVLADVGASTAADVVKAMRKMTWERRFRKGDEARAGLIELLTRLLDVGDTALKLDTKPSVILMVGVNGVGKTTTIGKIAAQLKAQGKNVLLCAGDTFRAAAAEQLGVWAERSGSDIVRHEEGSDPAAVVYDGLCAARARGADVVIIDTAGRLHNKVGLMNELAKMKRVVGKVVEGAPHEVLLVLDGSTGQNAFEQARQFAEATEITALAVTKLDGTAKGGVVIGISHELKVPVKYIGIGEKVTDLQLFDSTAFVSAIFDEKI